MKISYNHLIRNINSKPGINEVSDRLFQLGHEHETLNNIFDIEFTPNRGDCLSVNGLLRDLRLFYDIKDFNDIYEGDIEPFLIDFSNNAKEYCKNISFLQIEIDEIPKNYNNILEEYFLELNVKKNNFFTDISNFISYETGQPTHCYDSNKVIEPIKLDFTSTKSEFDTLFDKKIQISEDNLVFFDGANNIINLAGIMGGKDTSCNKNTKSVTIECAHFDPEIIIGKSIKYGINSEAAYKFERNTDYQNHNFVLRRFLKIIEDHTSIKNIKLYEENSQHNKKESILFDINRINKILGTNIKDNECIEYLSRLGFVINNNKIFIPSHRHDIHSINDISEEIARAVGYNNIEVKNFNISFKNKKNNISIENKLRTLLIDSGFYEVINNPFVSDKSKHSIIVDNPLDSNRKYLRTDLKNSLLNNLQYNERRQKDSIKLFEIADIYSSKLDSYKRVCGIIASGRVDKNYKDFTAKIDIPYLEKILLKLKSQNLDIEVISRQSIDSKSKNIIYYIEFEIDRTFDFEYAFDDSNRFNIEKKHYIPISDFPSSTRDLSFSIKDSSKCKKLEQLILNFDHSLLKEVFIFDYYKNEKTSEIKIGFRFIFQSDVSTITDEQVNNAINLVTENALGIDSISIPGLA